MTSSPSGVSRVMIETELSVVIVSRRVTVFSSTFIATAALSRPLLIDLAISRPVTPAGYSRREPSGRVIWMDSVMGRGRIRLGPVGEGKD